MPATQTQPSDAIRHEEFCLPRPGSTEPRIESYPHLEDDVATGRSQPVATVTRCLECGAARYDRQEK